MSVSTHPRFSVRSLLGAPIAALAALSASASLSAQSYTVTDIGTLGGPVAGGFSINNAGHIVGISSMPDANTHAFLWSSVLQDIAPLPGDLQSHAFAIADDDRVVAASYDLGDITPHGILWANGVATSLGNLAPRAISNSGFIVGSLTSLNASVNVWVQHAARWFNGATLDLGTLGGFNSFASAVADDGRIVGMSFLADNITRRAFLWQSGVFRDLGTLGGSSSQAYDISASGAVVGWAQLPSGAAHAFLFQLDAAGNVAARIDLGHLGNNYSAAYALNTHQHVVGVSASHAFLWNGSAMIDLNALIPPASGWRLDAAWDINDAGQIVGVGTYLGFPRAFLLTPHLCADITGDNIVDINDLTLVVFNWGTAHLAADINNDGVVNIDDLTAVILAWGDCP